MHDGAAAAPAVLAAFHHLIGVAAVENRHNEVALYLVLHYFQPLYTFD
jgi:hypothetical protein